MSLEGKVAIITGASSGIGQGVAVHFAKYGAKLALTGRNEERLEETKKLCVKANAKAHVYYRICVCYSLFVRIFIFSSLSATLLMKRYDRNSLKRL